MRSMRHITEIVSRLSGMGGLSSRLISHSAMTYQSPKTKVPAALWKLGNLNHVAIATPDLEKSTALYR